MNEELCKNVEETFHAALERARAVRQSFPQRAGTFVEIHELYDVKGMPAAESVPDLQFGDDCLMSPLGTGGRGED